MVVYKYGNDSIGGELNCNGEKEIKNVFLYAINRDPSNDEEILKVDKGSVFIIANPRFKSHEKFGRFESYGNEHGYEWSKVSAKEETIAYSRLWLNAPDIDKASELFLEYHNRELIRIRAQELAHAKKIEALEIFINAREVE